MGEKPPVDGCSGPDSPGLSEPPSEPFKSQKQQIFLSVSLLSVFSVQWVTLANITNQIHRFHNRKEIKVDVNS